MDANNIAENTAANLIAMAIVAVGGAIYAVMKPRINSLIGTAASAIKRNLPKILALIVINIIFAIIYGIPLIFCARSLRYFVNQTGPIDRFDILAISFWLYATFSILKSALFSTFLPKSSN